MSSSDHATLIRDFRGVTGVSEERAQFFLESAAWNLETAMSSFFDDDAPASEDIADPQSLPEVQQAPDAQPPSSGGEKKSAPKKSNTRFGTIASLQPDDSDSSDSEDPRQAFYTGGSEHGGGQQVLGPAQKNPDKFIHNMFKAARKHGAEEVSAGEAQGSSGSQGAAGPSFSGAGYRLGETEEASERVEGNAAAAPPRTVDVVLRLWRKGFTVDDGPLRDYHTPENREFIESIHQGHVPKELIRNAKGGQVNLNMEDHRGEEYVPSKRTVKAFSGTGHTLGSPAPDVVTEDDSAAFGGPSTSSAEGGAADAPAGNTITADSSKPVTSIQLRLADGNRLVLKCNHTHTVQDIRQHILALHPQYAARTFVLMTTFPNKELTDEKQTVEEAKLMNAVLVQRCK